MCRACEKVLEIMAEVLLSRNVRYIQHIAHAAEDGRTLESGTVRFGHCPEGDNIQAVDVLRALADGFGGRRGRTEDGRYYDLTPPEINLARQQLQRITGTS